MGLNTLEIFQNFSALSITSNPTLIAVSGGSDSLALLRLYSQFASENVAASPAHVVTINHGLREAAPKEAEFVASICAGLGLTHKTLCWNTDKPTSRLQEKAREARHYLLRQEARSVGASAILLGHTLNDQSETYLMRKERSNSIRGLAAMAPATLFCGDVWLARPLLTSARQDLRNYLVSINQRWVDDPSNQDTQFERVRIRSHMQETYETARAEAECQRRMQIEKAAQFVSQYFFFKGSFGFSCVPNFILADDAASLAFRFALALIGGQHHLPTEDASKDALLRLSKGAVTLSGCLIVSKEEQLHIKKEIRGDDRINGKQYVDETSLNIFDKYLPSFDLSIANAFAPFFDHRSYPVSPLGG